MFKKYFRKAFSDLRTSQFSAVVYFTYYKIQVPSLSKKWNVKIQIFLAPDLTYCSLFSHFQNGHNNS